MVDGADHAARGVHRSSAVAATVVVVVAAMTGVGHRGTVRPRDVTGERWSGDRLHAAPAAAVYAARAVAGEIEDNRKAQPEPIEPVDAARRDDHVHERGPG